MTSIQRYTTKPIADNQRKFKYSKTSLKRSKKLTQSATKELKSQGVNFSIGPGGDKSMHHQFVENIRKHGLRVWKDAHADGNCFFHSVVFILQQIGKNKECFRCLNYSCVTERLENFMEA
jgi:hypothetical protein